jgi:1,4-alpha-glucan branching enzyme
LLRSGNAPERTRVASGTISAVTYGRFLHPTFAHRDQPTHTHRRSTHVAITILTDPKTRQPKLRLVLPDDIHDGPVSVVGSFNDWTPGRHRLVRRANGTRSVTVPVTPGQQLRFRYLGSGGRWFDDPDAQRIETDGGVVGVVEV